jgi:integrase
MHVCQRADEYNEIGPTKSETSNRTIPIPPSTLAAVREWKLKCPRRDKELHYIFPSGGLELPLKVVQERLGHSSVVLTAGRYGHLFPADDDSAALAAAEGRFG